MQDLDKFKNEMNLSGKNVYVGHRYVPKLMGEWDNTKSYESLSIVQYQGNSFTSRQVVPIGVDINNDEFWVSTGNYNAQVENYRQEVQAFNERINENKNNIIENNNNIIDLKNDIESVYVNPTHYGLVAEGEIYEVINESFKHGNIIKLPHGSYKLSRKLEIPSGKILDLNYSTIRFMNGEACFNMSPNATLKNGHVTISGDIYQENPIVLFDGNKRFLLGNTETHLLENFTADKSAGVNMRQGTFIHLDATQKNIDISAAVSGVQIKNVKSFRFEYGIRHTLMAMEDSDKVSYISANVIESYHCFHPSKAIWEDDIVGTNTQLSDNNYYDVQVQADKLPIIFMRLVGRLNIFRSFIAWDYHRPTNQSDQFIIEGRYNHIEGTIPSYNEPYFKDTGFRNTIISNNTGVPTHKIYTLVTESTPKTLFEGDRRLLPINLFRNPNVVNSQTEPSELMSFSYDINSIPTGTSTFEFEAFGSAKVGTSRSFNLYLNSIYLSGGTSLNAQKDSFQVNAKLMITRYDNKQIIVSSLLTTSDGKQYGNRKYVDITNVDTIDILLNFHSSENDDMECFYREANIIKA